MVHKKLVSQKEFLILRFVRVHLYTKTQNATKKTLFLMSTITIIVIAFIIGYAFIALEAVTKINKAAVAILMWVVC